MKISHLALFVTGTLAAGAAPAMEIDLFDAVQIASAAGGNTVSNSVAWFPGANFIGTFRDLSAQSVGTGTTRGAINDPGNPAEPGLLDLANSNTSAGVIFVQWNGISGAASDFTENGHKTDFSLSLPTPVNTNLRVTFTVTGVVSGTPVVSTAFRDFAGGTSGTQFLIPFSDFLNQGVFRNVNTLRMTMSGSTGWDAQIQLIETAPIPGTLVLMGIGVAALARRVRRTRIQAPAI